MKKEDCKTPYKVLSPENKDKWTRMKAIYRLDRNRYIFRKYAFRVSESNIDENGHFKYENKRPYCWFYKYLHVIELIDSYDNKSIMEINLRSDDYAFYGYELIEELD